MKNKDFVPQKVKIKKIRGQTLRIMFFQEEEFFTAELCCRHSRGIHILIKRDRFVFMIELPEANRPALPRVLKSLKKRPMAV
jgi:hypothetical protein